MRFGLTLGAIAVLGAAGCVDFPVGAVEEWRVQRRGVQYPAVVERAPDGTERQVIYVPQGNTSFHIDYYDPYPYHYAPGYVTYYAPPVYYGNAHYGPAQYGGGYPAPAYYGQPYPVNERGPVYVPPGYAGGVLAPGGYAQPGHTGGGSKYYPGSGASTQPGESRESYGLYGNGNRR